jgi:hypothetical protein
MDGKELHRDSCSGKEEFNKDQQCNALFQGTCLKCVSKGRGLAESQTSCRIRLVWKRFVAMLSVFGMKYM